MSAQILDERLATWIAHETAIDVRVEQVKRELASAREALSGLENENHSLRMTFDLIVNEKALLLHRLAEDSSAIDDARSRIELLTTALTAAQIERKELIAEIAASHERLELIQHNLAAKEEKIRQLEQSRELLTMARTAAEIERKELIAEIAASHEKLELIQSSLAAKEEQIRQLEQSRPALIEHHSGRVELLTMALTAVQIERKELIAEIAASHEKLELIQNNLVAKEHQIRQLEQSRPAPIGHYSGTLLADTVTF
jgi:chromosome segregation ATPase